MGHVQFYNDHVLFADGHVAMDPSCCCGGQPPPTCDCTNYFLASGMSESSTAPSDHLLQQQLTGGDATNGDCDFTDCDGPPGQSFTVPEGETWCLSAVTVQCNGDSPLGGGVGLTGNGCFNWGIPGGPFIPLSAYPSVLGFLWCLKIYGGAVNVQLTYITNNPGGPAIPALQNGFLTFNLDATGTALGTKAISLSAGTYSFGLYMYNQDNPVFAQSSCWYGLNRRAGGGGGNGAFNDGNATSLPPGANDQFSAGAPNIVLNSSGGDFVYVLRGCKV